MQKFKPFYAPKSFTFKDPDTGYNYEAPSKQLLVKHIVNYREQNRLPPIEYILDVLENYWCSLPENEGSCEPVRVHRSLTEYLRGGIALLENIFYGEKNMVELSTANTRANICLPCPLNSFPDKEGFLKWSDSLAEAATDSKFRELPFATRNNLGTCLGCSCTLKAKVFYKPRITLTKDQEGYMRTYNPACWQLPEHQPAS